MDLVKKYNANVPRYTSFPSYPHWSGAPTSGAWYEQLKLSLDQKQNCEIYIHIPFCESLCRYCACNRVITKNHSIEREYVEAMMREWDLYRIQNFNSIITGIHLGGGTPTFLSPQNLDNLISYIKNGVKVSDHFRGSIELDPRVSTLEHLDVLKKHNFSKVSLGVQDFDEGVQTAINRIQSYELVESLIKKLRNKNIKSINFDLIYGLPLQSPFSIQKTMSKVCELAPDTIAFYSYARVPWKLKSQNLLEKYSIPEGLEKKELFDKGRSKLVQKGYQELGFDHFTKPSDPLFKAKFNNRLKRNFMGYTLSDANVLIGLGSSAISSSGYGFIQNKKDPKAYIKDLNKGKHAFENGHCQSILDQKISGVIQEIMCGGKSNILPSISSMSKPVAKRVIYKLDELVLDGLIDIHEGILTVKERGLPFIRNICQAFDYNFSSHSNNQFSKSI
jgi:oxygen-independent coproporphyrinogen-3 oxidase